MIRIYTLSLIFFLFIRTISAQCTLSIKQFGIKSDTLFIANYEEQPLVTSDSTLEFTLNPSPPDRIFVLIDRKAKWRTRVWMEPTIKHKELVVDYNKKTAVLKNPSEWDIITEKWSQLQNGKKQREADSIAVDYIKNNPDSYLSLYFISHGLYRENPYKKIPILETLSARIKEYPEYRQTKSYLLDRKIPISGDPFKEFVLTNISDSIFNSTTVKNKWVLLHFWSNGCAPCIKEMDDLVALYKSADTSRLEFISITLDENKNIWKNAKSTKKMIWPSLWQPDGSYCNLGLYYNLPAMPYFILFDPNKKIFFMKDGANELLNIKTTFKDKGLLK